jgi:hypothetical protein
MFTSEVLNVKGGYGWSAECFGCYVDRSVTCIRCGFVGLDWNAFQGF